jgi:transposase
VKEYTHSKRSFDDTTIQQIRSSYVYSNVTIRDIAKQYDTSIKTIWQIINMETYKNVPVNEEYYKLLKDKIKNL